MLNPEELVKIVKPTQHIFDIQREVLDELEQIFPNKEIELIGSMSVPMPGREEVDIMLITNDVNFDAKLLADSGYVEGPTINGIAYLTKYKDGVEIGVQVIPENQIMISIHRKIRDLLKSDNNLRGRYAEFKKTLNNLPQKEYKNRKEEWVNNNISNLINL